MFIIYMLTSTLYGTGYTCGSCISLVYGICCCEWCYECSLFNTGRCIYDICVCVCCNWTCDYEYCLIYCSGVYDGLTNKTEPTDHVNNMNEII